MTVQPSRERRIIGLERKAVSGIMLRLILTSMLTLAFNIGPAKAEETIYILLDGTVYPSTAPISKFGDLYTFTANIYDSIVVQRDNIIIDGAGYTIQGTGAWGSKGLDLSTRRNVTIQNMKIKTFWAGIGLYYASNNSIIGNNITNNNVCGVKLYFSSFNTIGRNNIVKTAFYGVDIERSSNNTLSCNTMADNSLSIFLRESANNNIIARNNITKGNSGISLQRAHNNAILRNSILANNGAGMFLSESDSNTVSGNNITNNKIFGGVYLYLSSSNVLCHNNLINNVPQVYLETSGYSNFWDDGYPSGGNYWSDYTIRYPSAQELDGSGIWDKPYVIDENNQDNYPLMNPWTPTPPTIMASLDIDPDTFNLRSKGQWITAYVQLPEGYDAADIEATTITLNGTIRPVLDLKYDFVTNSSEYLVDHNNDGVLERMAKFNRTRVSEYTISEGIMHGNVALTLTGQLTDGTLFEGSKVIRVMMPGDANIDGKINASDLVELGKAYGSTTDNINWNPRCDFNEDNKVDTSDLHDLVTNYGRIFP